MVTIFRTPTLQLEEEDEAALLAQAEDLAVVEHLLPAEEAGPGVVDELLWVTVV